MSNGPTNPNDADVFDPDTAHVPLESFTVELRALRSRVPVEVRLRRLLKVALRSCQLRCVRVEAVPPGSSRPGPNDSTVDRPIAPRTPAAGPGPRRIP